MSFPIGLPKLDSVVEQNGEVQLSAVAQDYLKVIWTASEWSEDTVSTKMLSERIGVSASTVSEAIRKLADQGMVDHARYGAISLTERGRHAAVAMVRRHRLIETYLVRELGYGWDEVRESTPSWVSRSETPTATLFRLWTATFPRPKPRD
jgi:DtxR family Mn-dependent transcriptional regulator